MFLNIIFLHVFKSNYFQVLIFGDMNFPDVNRDAHKSIHSDEQFLLDYLSQDLLLEQIFRSSTHKRGYILDLVFVSHSDLWDYVILNSSCSDHNPIIIKYAQSFSASISSDYSVTSFNKNVFEYSFVSGTACGKQVDNFFSYWKSNFDYALALGFKRKRMKRRNLPFYYSSLTVHHVNCNLLDGDMRVLAAWRYWKKNSMSLLNLIKLPFCPPLNILQSMTPSNS